MEKNKTFQNLMEAFAGESQARMKYLAYSERAQAEGKLNAAKLFKVASEAETIHALKEIGIAGNIHATVDNLRDAVSGETHEFTEMYPKFIKDAEKDGNKAAFTAFTFAMKAEEVHAKLYQDALDNIEESGEEVFYYLCPVCGNIEKCRPGRCSICGVSGDIFIKY